MTADLAAAFRAATGRDLIPLPTRVISADEYEAGERRIEDEQIRRDFARWGI